MFFCFRANTELTIKLLVQQFAIPFYTKLCNAIPAHTWHVLMHMNKCANYCLFGPTINNIENNKRIDNGLLVSIDREKKAQLKEVQTRK